MLNFQRIHGRSSRACLQIQITSGMLCPYWQNQDVHQSCGKAMVTSCCIEERQVSYDGGDHLTQRRSTGAASSSSLSGISLPRMEIGAATFGRDELRLVDLLELCATKIRPVGTLAAASRCYAQWHMLHCGGTGGLFRRVLHGSKEFEWRRGTVDAAGATAFSLVRS